jgi:hypothetical protein
MATLRPNLTGDQTSAARVCAESAAAMGILVLLCLVQRFAFTTFRRGLPALRFVVQLLLVLFLSWLFPVITTVVYFFAANRVGR